MAYGINGHVGLSFQESFGTAYTSSLDFFPFVESSIDDIVDPLVDQHIQHGKWVSGDHYWGGMHVAGDIVMQCHPIYTPKLIAAWTGQESAWLTTSHYQHFMSPRETDFTELLSALPPLTAEIYFGTGSAYQFSDIVVDELEFTFDRGNFNRVRAGILGTKGTSTAKSTPTYLTGSFLTWSTNSISLGGAAFEEFQTLRVLCKNNLALHYKFGSLYGARILRDDYRTVEISGTVLLSGQTQKSAVTTLAKQRLTVNMQRALTSNYIMIDIPAMTYTVYPRQIVSPGLLSVDFRGVGKLDATSQYQIQFTCVNTKSAYF